MGQGADLIFLSFAYCLALWRCSCSISQCNLLAQHTHTHRLMYTRTYTRGHQYMYIEYSLLQFVAQFLKCFPSAAFNFNPICYATEKSVSIAATFCLDKTLCRKLLVETLEKPFFTPLTVIHDQSGKIKSSFAGNRFTSYRTWPASGQE